MQKLFIVGFFVTWVFTCAGTNLDFDVNEYAWDGSLFYKPTPGNQDGGSKEFGDKVDIARVEDELIIVTVSGLDSTSSNANIEDDLPVLFGYSLFYETDVSVQCADGSSFVTNLVQDYSSDKPLESTMIREVSMSARGHIILFGVTSTNNDTRGSLNLLVSQQVLNRMMMDERKRQPVGEKYLNLFLAPSHNIETNTNLGLPIPEDQTYERNSRGFRVYFNETTFTVELYILSHEPDVYMEIYSLNLYDAVSLPLPEETNSTYFGLSDKWLKLDTIENPFALNNSLIHELAVAHPASFDVNDEGDFLVACYFVNFFPREMYVFFYEKIDGLWKIVDGELPHLRVEARTDSWAECNIAVYSRHTVALSFQQSVYIFERNDTDTPLTEFTMVNFNPHDFDLSGCSQIIAERNTIAFGSAGSKGVIAVYEKKEGTWWHQYEFTFDCKTEQADAQDGCQYETEEYGCDGECCDVPYQCETGIGCACLVSANNTSDPLLFGRSVAYAGLNNQLYTDYYEDVDLKFIVGGLFHDLNEFDSSNTCGSGLFEYPPVVYNYKMNNRSSGAILILSREEKLVEIEDEDISFETGSSGKNNTLPSDVSKDVLIAGNATATIHDVQVTMQGDLSIKNGTLEVDTTTPPVKVGGIVQVKNGTLTIHIGKNTTRGGQVYFPIVEFGTSSRDPEKEGEGNSFDNVHIVVIDDDNPACTFTATGEQTDRSYGVVLDFDSQDCEEGDGSNSDTVTIVAIVVVVVVVIAVVTIVAGILVVLSVLAYLKKSEKF